MMSGNIFVSTRKKITADQLKNNTSPTGHFQISFYNNTVKRTLMETLKLIGNLSVQNGTFYLGYSTGFSNNSNRVTEMC